MTSEKVFTDDASTHLLARVGDADIAIVGAGITSASGGLSIYPQADSTTSILLKKADGSTVVISIDTTNGVLEVDPVTARAPLVIGANGQGQVVVGLNADQLDGYHASDFTKAWPGGEPLGFLDRTSSTVTWNNTSKKLSVAVKSPATEFIVYEYGGTKYTYTTTQESTISSPAAGVWYFYFESGTLTNSTSWDFTKALVAFVTLDASNNSIGLTDERHGLVMDWKTHAWGHETIGTRWEEGLAATRIATGSGSADGDAQLYLGGGTIWDEDLDCTIVRSASPTNDFEQELGTSGVPGKFPIYYRSSTGSFNWVKLAATNFPCYQISAGQRITYNLDTAGTWSAAQISGNNRFSCMFVVATNNFSEPVICIMGQWDDASLPSAVARTFGDLALGSLPFKEMKPLYKVIFGTSTGYANNIKAYVAQLTDLRNAVSLPSGNFVSTAHNSLSLRDDANCHPATAISVDASGFGTNLPVTDDTPQKCFTTINGLSLGGSTLLGYPVQDPLAGFVADGAELVFSSDRFQWEALDAKPFVRLLPRSSQGPLAEINIPALDGTFQYVDGNAYFVINESWNRVTQQLYDYSPVLQGNGAILAYNVSGGIAFYARTVPRDGYNKIYIPCNDYGTPGTNKITSYINSVNTAITMTAVGATGRQLQHGLFTEAIGRCYLGSNQAAAVAGTAFTISAWIYPFIPPGATTTYDILRTIDNVSNYFGIAFRAPSASDYTKLYPCCRIGGTPTDYGTFTYNTDTDLCIPLFQWSHVAATFSVVGTTCTYYLYVNGMLAETGAVAVTTGMTGITNINQILGNWAMIRMEDARVDSTVRSLTYLKNVFKRGFARFDAVT